MSGIWFGAGLLELVWSWNDELINHSTKKSNRQQFKNDESLFRQTVDKYCSASRCSDVRMWGCNVPLSCLIEDPLVLSFYLLAVLVLLPWALKTLLKLVWSKWIMAGCSLSCVRLDALVHVIVRTDFKSWLFSFKGVTLGCGTLWLYCSIFCDTSDDKSIR